MATPVGELMNTPGLLASSQMAGCPRSCSERLPSASLYVMCMGKSMRLELKSPAYCCNSSRVAVYCW
ncbi:MAG: hypothetical protein J6U43_03670 [Bacteroidales bacterium]|nr:hypothetical protein [Bacteroidales bacterium]